MRTLHGNGWQAKVEEFEPYIRARAKEDKTSPMAGAIRLANQASADHRPHLTVMLLAVGCELTSENVLGELRQGRPAAPQKEKGTKP